MIPRRVLVILLAAAVKICAADDLPQKGPHDLPEVEPKLMPDARTADPPAETAGGLPQMEAALERAKKNADAGEGLVRAGVLAKVEAEKRALNVVKLKLVLERARLAAAQAALEAAKHGPLEALRNAVTAAAIADASARQAEADWQRAELNAAELNLQRQKQLLRFGIGSRAAARRAEERLAALRNAGSP